MGLTKVIFTFGSTKDEAEFLTTKSKLARYVGTQSWPELSVALRAIEDMTNPKMTPPSRPKVEKDGLDGTVVTQDRDDSEFKMECKYYSVAEKNYQAKKERWDNNQPRAYNLVL